MENKEEQRPLKSPYRLAKEIGVTNQAVYKKINGALSNQLDNHIQRTSNGKILLDAAAEEIIRQSFQEVVQPIEQPIVQPSISPLDNRLDSHLLQENSFLRQRIEMLESELRAEREHSKELADKVESLAEKAEANTDRALDLTNQLMELMKANQVLLGIEQSKTNPSRLVENTKNYKRLSIFKWFKRH